MWKDDKSATRSGKVREFSTFIPGKEFTKGGKTKYNIYVYTDAFELEHHDKVIFRVQCNEAEIKTKSLKSSNLEDAKKEALILVKNKIKEKIELMSSFENMLEEETK